jgi:TetR/AcrR family transcriptional repressor of nem operon
MGRPRIYDEDAVIDKALKVFWVKGFSDTSSRDLLAATGLSNGSLFNSFNDKASLYLACLQKYNTAYTAALEDLLLSEIPFKEKITKVFRGTAKKLPGSDAYEGCFFFNSSLDSGIHDEAIIKLIAAIQFRLEQAFCTAVDLAIENKELPSTVDKIQTARYLMMLTSGLRAMAKSTAPIEEMEHMISYMLQQLHF